MWLKPRNNANGQRVMQAPSAVLILDGRGKIDLPRSDNKHFDYRNAAVLAFCISGLMRSADSINSNYRAMINIPEKGWAFTSPKAIVCTCTHI
jgi:hypothetical protein